MTAALWGVWIWADNVPVMDVYFPALVQFVFYLLIFQIIKFFVDFWKWKIENGVKFRTDVTLPMPQKVKKQKKKKRRDEPETAQQSPLVVTKIDDIEKDKAAEK